MRGTRYPPKLAVGTWQPNYCIANLYRTGEDFTGIHSDPLTQLGPQCIIASVSLGAARLFKLRPAGRRTNKAEVSAADKVGVASCYTLRLPHNSLLVMWEGCQENFRDDDGSFDDQEVGKAGSSCLAARALAVCS